MLGRLFLLAILQLFRSFSDCHATVLGYTRTADSGSLMTCHTTYGRSIYYIPSPTAGASCLSPRRGHQVLFLESDDESSYPSPYGGGNDPYPSG